MRISSKMLIAIGLLLVGCIVLVVINHSSNSANPLNVLPQNRNIYDWITLFNSQSDKLEQFNGQIGDVTGMVYRDARYDIDTQFMIGGFTPPVSDGGGVFLGLLVQAQDAKNFAQETWVHVKGTFQVQLFNGQKTPILIAATVEKIAQPADPYLDIK